MRPTFILCISVLLLLCAIPLMAQDEAPATVTDQNRTGDLPFSSTVGTSLEHVVIASGDLVVNIPIIHVKGRAGLDFDFGLRYDGHILVQAFRGTTEGYVWTFQAHNYLPSSGIWQTNQATMSYITSTRTACFGGLNGSGTATDINGYILQDAQGAQHSLNVNSEQAECPNGQWSFENSGPDTDNQGIWAQFSSARFPSLFPPLFANGTAFGAASSFNIAESSTASATVLVGGIYEDSNGNSTNNLPAGVDSLGRAIVTQTNGTNSVSYSVHASDGSSPTYTAFYSNISIQTAFGAGTGSQFQGTRPAVTSVELPNGKSYTFGYDSYGSLTSIGLPTGGSITYTWANFGTTPAMYRYVATRTVTVNGVSSKWTFSRSNSGCSPCNSCDTSTTVTDPLNNQSVYGVERGQICLAQIYNGAASGTPVKQVYVDYTQLPDNSLLPGQVQTTLDNGLVSETDYTYDTFTYNYSYCPNDLYCETNGPISGAGNGSSRGNVKEIDEYDWGSGSHGPLLRKILKTYLHDQNPAYAAGTVNIVDKVVTDTTQDGSGNQVAQTQYQFDNYTGSTAMLSTSGAPEHDYTGHSTAFTLRGNATQVERWRNTDGAELTTSYIYDDLGNIRAIQDPKGNTTTFTYTDSWANSSCAPPSNSLAYVTDVKNALNQQTQLTYFPCTSLIQAHKDQNDINAARAGTTFTYDFMNRLLAKTSTDGGKVADSYNDTSPVSVTTSSSITASANLTTTSIEDGLGRVIQTQVTSDQQGTIYTDTAYDLDGRKASVSNPYRTKTDTTYGVTSYLYDALARPTTVTEPDGSLVGTLYSGNCATATDEQGKNRESCSDGLGRMTTVVENPGGLGYQTTYTYDALDDLTQVVQNGSRQRNFTYNSLAQLTQSVNPESGTITYAYDPDGNLSSKTAPAPNQTGSNTVTLSYCYDALNRRTGKAYTAQSCPLSSPVATYTYDQTSANGLTITNGIGRRTSMTDPAGSEAWSYDSMGRVLTDQRTTNGLTKSVLYTYSPYLNGSIANIVYPSTLSLTYTYDGVGRPLSATDENGVKYANAATYAPQGALQTATFDATSNFPGFTISNSYNRRLGPNERKVSSSAGTAIDFSYCFYALSGGSCPSTGTTYNGNVMAIANNVDTTRSQVFSYDALNRISTGASVNTSGTNCWGEQYGYDAWGNLLTVVKPSGYSACALPDTVSATVNGNNQITVNQISANQTATYTYDSAGNVDTISGPGSATYVYNAENQMTSTAGVAYTYDGDGKRAEKSTGPLYWYGMSGDVLEEVLVNGAVQNDYVFFGGSRIAKRDASGDIFAYFSDHLATSRKVVEIAVGASAATVSYDADFYPFGTEHAFIDSTDPIHKFTSKERDSESNLDNFGARYNSSSMGRFLSPDWSQDPAPVPNADFENPQSLNLYSYVQNNPVTDADPDGHCDWCQKFKNRLFGDGWLTDDDQLEQRRQWLIGLAANDASKDAIRNAPADKINYSYECLHDSTCATAYMKYMDALTQAAAVIGSGLVYGPNPKHGPQQSGDVSPEPKDGPGTLQNSVPIKESSTARVGVDKTNNEFVMFRETSPGNYHGYAVRWSELTNEAKSALIKAGEVTARGKIIP